MDSKTRARERLNAGVQAFKSGDIDQAIEDFKVAKALDPWLLNARLYLATSYADHFIPGVPSEENARMGELAIEEFKGVLAVDPKNLSAIDGLGAVLYSLAGTPFDPAKLEEAKSYHLKHIEIKPEDPTPYYWVGVIDWTIAYQTNKSLRREFNKLDANKISDTDPLPPTLAAQFHNQEGGVVEEGIENLRKAMDRQDEYDDARAYLNLLYRQKADMEPTSELRGADQKIADELVDQVRAHKMKKLEQSEPK